MAGYTRQDVSNNIADGNIINASDFDNEYNAIEAAFNASTGHTHDGTAAEGAPITKIGPTQDVIASTSALTPKTDNTVDLGSSTLEFKDLYIDGTANIDSLAADAATVSGTTTLSGLTASTALALNSSKEVVSVTNTGTGNNVLSASPTLTGTVAGASMTLSSLTSGRVTYAGASGLLQDSANFTFNGTDLTVSGAVNAGSINATTLDLTNLEVTNIKAKDGTSAATIADSTGVVSFTANPVMSAGTANGVTYLNGSKVLTSGSALTFDGSEVFKNSGGTIQYNDVRGSAAAGTRLSAGGTLGSDSFDLFQNSTGGHVFNRANTPLIFGVNNAEQMRLTSTGLGIGTNSPGAKLEVIGSVRAAGTVSVGYASGFDQTYIAPNGATGNGSIMATVNFAASAYQPFTQDASYFAWRPSGTEGMRLTSTGLGIGTSSSSTKFQVTYSGASNFNVGSSFAKVENLAGASASFIMADTTDSATVKNVGSSIAFVNSSSEGMRLTSTGLGIGTSSPASKLEVSNAGDSIITVTGNTASGNVAGVDFQRNGGTVNASIRSQSVGSNDAGEIFFSTRPFGGSLTERMRIDSSGNVGIGTSSPAYPLDVTGYGRFSSGIVGASGLLMYGDAASATGLLLDASGNLGLGVTPSAWSGYKPFQVGSGASFGGYANDVLSFVGSNVYNDNTNWKYILSGNAAARYQQSGGVHAWYTAPSGTAGDAISFTQAMTLDASGRLGIGTTAVEEKLHVAAANPTNGVLQFLQNTALSAQTGALLKLDVGNVGTAAIGIPGGTANALAFYVGGVTSASEQMRLDSSGNLGLGVTPSASTRGKGFDIGVSGGLYGDGINVSHSTHLTSNAYPLVNGDWIYKNSSQVAQRYSMESNGNHVWFTAPSGTAGDAISFTQAMTLDVSGNLGVGVTSPVAKIEVNGDIATAYGSGGKISLRETDATRGNQLVASADANGSLLNATFSTGGTAVLRFQTANTERARITSAGDLLVGTTSGNDGQIKIDGTSNGANCAIWAKNAGGATSPTQVLWNNGTSGDNKFVEFYTETSATVRGSITYNRAGGLVAYNTTSDYRAKDIIGPVANPGATIDALKVYTGKMKGAAVERPMLVAHEAQAVAPYSVTGEKDAVNDNGDPVFQQMDVSSLVPLLIAEIQSLRARVAALESN